MQSFLSSARKKIHRFERFGAAENQCPFAIQGVMKQLGDIALHVAIQIDQKIAAGNEIDAREGRIREQIVPGKYNEIANLLANPVAAVFLLKEAVQTILADVGPDIVRIKACRALFERASCAGLTPKICSEGGISCRAASSRRSLARE